MVRSRVQIPFPTSQADGPTQEACKYSRFSLLLAATEVSTRGTSRPDQRQKFHTHDVNQCLHNKSESHGVLNINLFDLMFLLVNFDKVFCSTANEFQQNSGASSKEEIKLLQGY